MLRQALRDRVVVADGGMGTMLQAAAPTLDDFEGHEGCNEVLNVTRPDVVRGVHDEYFAAGADCVETNTFGANLANLGEYGIARSHRGTVRGGRPDRRRGRRRAVHSRPAALGARLDGAGHQAAHPRPRALRGPARRLPAQAAGLIAGGADALIVETCQDLLQAKAAIIGAKRAIAAAGAGTVLIAQVTVENNGTMLLGTEIGAALTALEPLGVDLIGLNCATGPAEMSEHLRYLARHAPCRCPACPTPACPSSPPTARSTR